MQFLHFKLCQTAVFEPLDLWTGYIHVLKALKADKLTQYLKIGVEGENIWLWLWAFKRDNINYLSSQGCKTEGY